MGLRQGHRLLYRGIQTMSPHPLCGRQTTLLCSHGFWVPHIMLLQQPHQATLGHRLAAASDSHPTCQACPTATLQYSSLRSLLPRHPGPPTEAPWDPACTPRGLECLRSALPLCTSGNVRATLISRNRPSSALRHSTRPSFLPLPTPTPRGSDLSLGLLVPHSLLGILLIFSRSTGMGV